MSLLPVLIASLNFVLLIKFNIDEIDYLYIK